MAPPKLSTKNRQRKPVSSPPAKKKMWHQFVSATGKTVMATARASVLLGTGALVALCISPSMTANVWPRLHAIMSGDTDASLVSMANFQIVAVLAMAACPLAFLNSKDATTRISALILGFVLLVINLGNATDTISHVRETAANGPLAAQLKAKSLNERITRDTEARKAMGSVVPTSEMEVQAAQSAVDAAKQAQAQECGKVGERCRARQIVTQNAVERLSTVSAQRATSSKAERLDKELDDARRELDAIGPIPAHADAIAYRLSKLGLSEEWISDNWPTLGGLAVELLGLLGPIVFMGAVRTTAQPARADKKAGRKTVPKKQDGSKNEQDKQDGENSAQDTAQETVMQTILPVTVCTFRDAKLDNRLGKRVLASDMYILYVEYCEEMGVEPLGQTAFGRAMKDEANVKKQKIGGTAYYLDVALMRGNLRLVK